MLAFGRCNILFQSAADDDGSRQSTNNRHLQQSIRASDASGRRGVAKGTGKHNCQDYPRASWHSLLLLGPCSYDVGTPRRAVRGEKPAGPILPGALRILVGLSVARRLAIRGDPKAASSLNSGPHFVAVYIHSPFRMDPQCAYIHE